jgi:hypothetical protein
VLPTPGKGFLPDQPKNSVDPAFSIKVDLIGVCKDSLIQ